MPTIQDHLIRLMRATADYHPNVQTAPHCILWTDAAAQWQSIIPTLQAHLPELYVLGDYAPEQRQGPALWLRCVLARSLPDEVSLPADTVPIFYLPGVSRQDLRATESCPDLLKPLAELQYRGKIWSQENAKDWTILAFLVSRQGLNLDVSSDEATKTALQISLPYLLASAVQVLQERRLDQDDFYQLIIQDLAGEMLQWLNDDIGYQQQHDAAHWQAFVELCQRQYRFHPAQAGVISAASKLLEQKDEWAVLWRRYCEAAQSYPAIRERLAQVKPPQHELEWRDPRSTRYLAYPQWNRFQEEQLREALGLLVDMPVSEAQAALLRLEEQHAERRALLWAKLGEAPLAQALAHLKTLAEISRDFPLNGGTLDDLTERYQSAGWRADSAVLQALAEVSLPADIEIVKAVIHALYEPWASASARHLQAWVTQHGYPATPQNPPAYPNGTCVLFVDGLRFDLAQRLAQALATKHLQVNKQAHWSALPSVTATGKPAVSPVREQFVGADLAETFEPIIRATGKSANHANHQDLLAQAGWQILSALDLGDVNGRAWTEIKSIDEAGHQGVLVKHIADILREIQQRVESLLAHGWQTVEIVTDHGWLFLPNGLPKIILPTSLTQHKWGRCAALKPKAQSSERLFPWFWNPQQHFVLADGISSFWAGNTYAHGGLSLQECLTPQLSVRATHGAAQSATFSITQVTWRGLRCDMLVEGGNSDWLVDIRTLPAKPTSTLLESPKPLKPNGKTTVLIPDDDLMGTLATLVIVTVRGQLMAQMQITIGGDRS